MLDAPLSRVEFDVVVKSGKSHVLVDHLSWLLTHDNEEGVSNDLLDAALFLINADLPCYAGIANFLSTAAYPTGASKQEQKKLLLQARHYSLFGGYLY